MKEKIYCVNVTAHDNTWHITAKNKKEAIKEAVRRFKADVNIKGTRVALNCPSH